MVVGGESPESSDLVSIDCSEFGDFGEELVCGCESDAGYAGEDFGFGSPLVTGVEEFRNGDFDVNKLLIEQRDCVFDGFDRQFSVDGVLPIFLDGSELKDLSSPGDKVLQFLLIFRCFRCEGRFDEFGELCQVTGINGVGLGTMSESFGKVSCLSGIDHSHGDFVINEVGYERSFVAAGGLDNEELECGKLFEKLDEQIEP